MRALIPLIASAALVAGCKKEGCLTGNDPECIVPSPCEDLAFSCSSGSVSLRVLAPGDPALSPGNPLALAAPGDIVLENDHVQVVIEALDHPHYIAPTGGGIVDFAIRGRDNDSLRSVFQGTGLLPTEAFHYTSLRTFEEDGLVAVQVNGHLDGFPDIKVATRYELRPCDPGVRVRSEVVNRTPDPQTWFVTDAWYWGGRELLAFTPGRGFRHPSFGLTTVLEAFDEVPFMAAGLHTEPAASYATVACNVDALNGFQSEEVTAMGLPNRVVMPREYEIFERFHGVVDGASISRAADLAMDVRSKLFGEPYATIRGKLEANGSAIFGDPVHASIHVLADGPPGASRQVTHIVPEPDGSFSARVPPHRIYRLLVESFGQPHLETTVKVGARDVEVQDLQLTAGAPLTLNATVDGEEDHVLVFLHPADEPTRLNVTGRFLGHFETCAPLLGHPHGPSPSCNRVLVNGPTTVLVPPGRYHVAAAAGLFSTLAVAEDVEIGLSGATVDLAIETLPLPPPGALTADFHVHGAASFDAMIPDEDRVRALLASRIEVIALTEHDANWDYADAVAALDAQERIHLIPGTEATGHILMPLLDSTIYPKVFGHWNAWPVPFDPIAPWHGAPWDELVQPGALFDRLVDAGWPRETGVLQLNHPVGGLQFGRDFGWFSAIELDFNSPPSDNPLFDTVPGGASFSNADYHVQEVMNGTANLIFAQYRHAWHHLLNHGYLRGGTANSDSHSLTENVVGIPLTLVLADLDFHTFDLATFHEAVRNGRMIGTSGPVIEVFTEDAGGELREPSLTPFTPSPSAELTIRVTAAPWVPVDEVRVVVNGEVVHTLPLGEQPDPLRSDLTPRLETRLPLADLLPARGDAWLVVEAGVPLVRSADLDCDGLPDTGDNNGDGRIDWQDVEGLTEDPGENCLSEVGPPAEPPPPAPGSPGWYYQLVVPDGHPTAFTNPLVLDLDGNGYQGAAR